MTALHLHLPREPFHIKKAILENIRALPTTIVYMAAATLVSTLMFHFTDNLINVSLVYILAIILNARATSCYGAGIIASLYSVFWVNFAFSVPYMKLNFTLSGYPLTFLGMTFISCFTSSICIMISRQTALIREQDRKLMNAEKETMRANLLRAVSHDLRTPLTTIIGSSATYLEREDSMSATEKRQLVANIEEDAQWLLNMVENLLSVTRIQDSSGSLAVVKSEEPLEEVISEAVQRFRKRFPDALVRVTIPGAFIMVPMDAKLIEQVINNLLENALFHSESHEPIDLIARTENGVLFITIKDYGKGIDSSRFPTLFDGGGVCTNQSGDGRKGMGIGLSICKTIINAHGGSIEAANHASGAMFTFTLPDWREY